MLLFLSLALMSVLAMVRVTRFEFTLYLWWTFFFLIGKIERYPCLRKKCTILRRKTRFSVMVRFSFMKGKFWKTIYSGYFLFVFFWIYLFEFFRIIKKENRTNLKYTKKKIFNFFQLFLYFSTLYRNQKLLPQFQ